MQPKQNYEQYVTDKTLRDLAGELYEKGQVQAAQLGVDGLSNENLAGNICFHRVVMSDLIVRIVALEKKVKELESNTDGNRFTKGIDL